MVEFRIRLIADEGGTWQLFWGEETATGFAERRSLRHRPVEDDSEFHIYQYNLGPALESRLTNIRLDPGNGPGTTLEVDYVRIGRVVVVPDLSPKFLRGDTDGNGGLDITDAIGTLNYLFTGTFDPPCLDALDFDDDGSVVISDAVASLTYQFAGGPPPPDPGTETCGPDPSDADPLDCATPPEGCL